eukprot:1585116-Rhodomonas_salina.2
MDGECAVRCLLPALLHSPECTRFFLTTGRMKCELNQRYPTSEGPKRSRGEQEILGYHNNKGVVFKPTESSSFQ